MCKRWHAPENNVQYVERYGISEINLKKKRRYVIYILGLQKNSKQLKGLKKRIAQKT